jgi:hypothetical protein
MDRASDFFLGTNAQTPEWFLSMEAYPHFFKLVWNRKPASIRSLLIAHCTMRIFGSLLSLRAR